MTKGNVDARPTLFKTYDTSTGFQSVKIWEVARATSAATTFFKSIKCGRDRVEFIDAGIKYNNPCEVLIEEGKDVFKDATAFKILSIGTGLGDVVAINKTRKSILKALKDLATSSKQVSDRLETANEGNELYYRFNVQNGLQDVTLSDWEQASDISAHTMNYLNDNRTKIRRCATIFANGHTQQQEQQQQQQQQDLGPVTHQQEQGEEGQANELP
jgi:patatin-like phospholipase/acyl hydrolase